MASSCRAVIVCTSFYPPLAARCAVAAQRPEFDLVGIQYYFSNPEYAWFERSDPPFGVVTLFKSGGAPSAFSRILALWRACRAAKARAFFFYQYDLPEQFICALVLRAAGKKCFAMYDSTFQDYPRRLGREALKAVMFAPYHGAMAASTRSRDYLRFLGFRTRPVALHNCNIDLTGLAGQPHDSEEAFLDRDFVVIARLVPKKNVAAAISAFRLDCELRPHSRRRLKICGDGPLRKRLEAHAVREGVAGRVDFLGYCSPQEVSQTLQKSAALILLSTEEPFGIAIVEALAHGVPVVASNCCGASADFIASGENGFVVGAAGVAGAARCLGLLTESFDVWKTYSVAARTSAQRGDAQYFGRSMAELLVATEVCPAAPARAP